MEQMKACYLCRTREIVKKKNVQDRLPDIREKGVLQIDISPEKNVFARAVHGPDRFWCKAFQPEAVVIYCK